MLIGDWSTYRYWPVNGSRKRGSREVLYDCKLNQKEELCIVIAWQGRGASTNQQGIDNAFTLATMTSRSHCLQLPNHRNNSNRTRKKKKGVQQCCWWGAKPEQQRETMLLVLQAEVVVRGWRSGWSTTVTQRESPWTAWSNRWEKSKMMQAETMREEKERWARCCLTMVVRSTDRKWRNGREKMKLFQL